MLEDQLYREALLEVFRNPGNRGEITKPDLEAKLLNPLCGDEVRIQIELANREQRTENSRTIKKAVFSGNGCAISQASASLLASHIEGKPLSEVKNLETSDILNLIGINPTPARMGCALLSLEVLMETLGKVKIEKLKGKNGKI